ncbi:hypothetical protein Q6331_29435, partial [Klebsiella pneumoniae]
VDSAVLFLGLVVHDVLLLAPCFSESGVKNFFFQFGVQAYFCFQFGQQFGAFFYPAFGGLTQLSQQATSTPAIPRTPTPTPA